ncbi:BTB-domain-containing protein [Gigaspora margarita]|uniref:BTB-domain-containing protein n=1 Tax=Gigaspora margarita TaxID=4874 RepID=A0A8H4B521_GIGMA|nr:BTB-domain-containing protein [Gigaspora margarita]
MNNKPNQKFSNLLEYPKDFDIKIKVGEHPNIKEFKAHSIILSSRSDYFKAEIFSRWAKREDGFIILNKPNISPPVFEILLNYIYTGIFSKNNEVSFLEIFIAADEIGLFEISQQIEKRLLETESAWKFPKDYITICKYDAFTNLREIAFKFKRNEALEYLRKGKYLKALEFYEEILKNIPYSAEDQKSASNWDLSNYRCGSEELNELSKKEEKH